jgi:hypothetical protein
MNLSFELSVEVSKKYDFNKKSLDKINENPWVKNQWPLVYFIQNEGKHVAYVGESTNFSNRIKNHLANPKKRSPKLSWPILRLLSTLALPLLQRCPM